MWSQWYDALSHSQKTPLIKFIIRTTVRIKDFSVQFLLLLDKRIWTTYTDMSSCPFMWGSFLLNLLLTDKIIWTCQAIQSLFLFRDASNYLELHWKANYKICNFISCFFIHKTFLAGFMILEFINSYQW